MIKNKPKYWTKKLEKKFDSLIVKCFSDKATDIEKEEFERLSDLRNKLKGGEASAEEAKAFDAYAKKTKSLINRYKSLLNKIKKEEN